VTTTARNSKEKSEENHTLFHVKPLHSSLQHRNLAGVWNELFLLVLFSLRTTCRDQ